MKLGSICKRFSLGSGENYAVEDPRNEDGKKVNLNFKFKFN